MTERHMHYIWRWADGNGATGPDGAARYEEPFYSHDRAYVLAGMPDGAELVEEPCSCAEVPIGVAYGMELYYAIRRPLLDAGDAVAAAVNEDSREWHHDKHNGERVPFSECPTELCRQRRDELAAWEKARKGVIDDANNG